MKMFLIFLILLPVVSFLFTYIAECVVDGRSPMKVKENKIDLILGGISFALTVSLCVFVYFKVVVD